MTLDTALRTALTGLNVNQNALALISNNITNANTQGYVRRIITQSTVVINGLPAGVRVDNVQRAVDDYLLSSSRTQGAKVGRAQALTDINSRIQLFFGQPGSTNALNSYMDKFFNAIADLADSPEQSFFRSSAVNSGVSLANRISGLADNLERTRYESEQEIVASINKINDITRQLSNINKSIKNASVIGADKNTLFDERDRLLADLNKEIDVDVTILSNGEANVFTSTTDLVNSEQLYKLKYTPATLDDLINDEPQNNITVVLLNENGTETGTSRIFFDASDPNSTAISGGKLKGLLEMRNTTIPNMLAQLDEVASKLSAKFNAIHNSGSGFPPIASYTGTRITDVNEERLYSGNFRLAVVDAQGRPVNSNFSDDGGLRALTLDLARLNGGNGDGRFGIKTLINEINSYYGYPSNRVALGGLSSINLASTSNDLNPVAATGSLEFDSNPDVGDTITIGNQTFTFKDDGLPSTGNTIELGGNLAATLSEVSDYLNEFQTGTVKNATYSASATTLNVTFDTEGESGNSFVLGANLAGGALAQLNGAGGFVATPSGSLDGGLDSSGNFTFDFELENFSGEDKKFDVLGVTVTPPGNASTSVFNQYTINDGSRERTDRQSGSNDSITVNLDGVGGNLSAGQSYTIAVQVRVTNEDGSTSLDTVEYEFEVPEPGEDFRNTRITPTAVSGSGDADIVVPDSNQRFLIAEMVDANGNVVQENGYLRIRSTNDEYRVVFDQLDSKELGIPNDAANTRTNRGLAHFFGLNNFFSENDTVKGSAINLSVRADIISNVGRFSTGRLSLSAQPGDPDDPPVYTYDIGVGSNQIAQLLSDLKTAAIDFDEAGTINEFTTNFNSYAGEITSFAAQQFNEAEELLTQEGLIQDGFTSRIESFAGVNIDEELANTVFIQNNYAASARVISIVSELFNLLIESAGA